MGGGWRLVLGLIPFSPGTTLQGSDLDEILHPAKKKKPEDEVKEDEGKNEVKEDEMKEDAGKKD